MRNTSQFLVSSTPFTELSPSERYWIHFAADQIAATAVTEISPIEFP